MVHHPGLPHTTEAKTGTFLFALSSEKETTGPISQAPNSILVQKLKKVIAVYNTTLSLCHLTQMKGLINSTESTIPFEGPQDEQTVW